MPKEKKEKKSKSVAPDSDAVMSEAIESTVIATPSAIAFPMADAKLLKKAYKVIKKASKEKQVKRGVKEVVKGIRKGEKGIVFIAGDISPIDVITHLPVFCEEEAIPYVYVPSKMELGAAGQTKRPTSCIFVSEKAAAENKESYGQVATALKALETRPPVALGA